MYAMTPQMRKRRSESTLLDSTPQKPQRSLESVIECAAEKSASAKIAPAKQGPERTETASEMDTLVVTSCEGEFIQFRIGDEEYRVPRSTFEALLPKAQKPKKRSLHEFIKARQAAPKAEAPEEETSSAAAAADKETVQPTITCPGIAGEMDFHM
eukprot:TRINITY_DN1476_c1_g1_i1.p1 TRINITY_DN1476_c1_g1~~TRINITY_DN1476_c1_g1_i1.p1  ORF type:complete len:155 (+),score=40.14 TRINITY_DN1476_c1_g1_i1:75-539(+)